MGLCIAYRGTKRQKKVLHTRTVMPSSELSAEGTACRFGGCQKEGTSWRFQERLKSMWDDLQWLFPNPEGNFYTYSGIIKIWNRDVESSGLRRRTPHDLRHTYATLRLSMGHPLPGPTPGRPWQKPLNEIQPVSN
jgi:hypothetical protein